MNKSELIEKLAQRCSINVVQAEEVVNLVYRKMRDTLVSGGRIEIVDGLKPGMTVATRGAFLLKAELGKGEAEH